MFKEFLAQHNRINDRVNRIVRPLCDLFPFTHIWHYSISMEGDYVCIGSHQEWTEYFFCNAVYRKMGHFLKHPKYFCNSNVLCRASDVSLETPSCQPCHNNSFLVMFEKNNKGLSGFGFGSECSNTEIDNIYLNQIPLLKKFAKYFRNEIGQFILDAEAEPLSLKKVLGADFFTPAPTQSIAEEKKYKKLLHGLGIELPPHLSSQEKRCLKLTLSGKGAGSVAREMKLSSRTIEHYLENLKNKFLCDSKEELFDKALLVYELGLIK